MFGVHRSLGTHVSKVRSLRLDRLSDATLRFLEAVGNDRCNQVFEQALSPDMKPRQNTDSKRLQAFIRSKWAQRAYVSSDGVDPDGALRDAVAASDVLSALAALAAAPDPAALLARLHNGEAPLHLAAQKGDLVVAALTGPERRLGRTIERGRRRGAAAARPAVGRRGGSAYGAAAAAVGASLTMVFLT